MSVVEKKTSKSIADYDLMTLGCRVLGRKFGGKLACVGCADLDSARLRLARASISVTATQRELPVRLDSYKDRCRPVADGQASSR